MYEKITQYYVSIIPNVSTEQLNDMLGKLVVKEIKKGDHLIKPGQICDHVYFINKGFFRFYHIDEAKDISIGFFGEGQYVSEYASFLTREPTHYHIESLENSEILGLNYNDMQWLYKKHPIFETFARILAERLFIMLDKRTYALLATSPEDRYKQLMEKQSILLQKVPQYLLASYLGITPEHLSRIRKKMLTR